LFLNFTSREEDVEGRDEKTIEKKRDSKTLSHVEDSQRNNSTARRHGKNMRRLVKVVCSALLNPRE
jgi:hypothetical protein